MKGNGEGGEKKKKVYQVLSLSSGILTLWKVQEGHQVDWFSLCAFFTPTEPTFGQTLSYTNSLSPPAYSPNLSSSSSSSSASSSPNNSSLGASDSVSPSVSPPNSSVTASSKKLNMITVMLSGAGPTFLNTGYLQELLVPAPICGVVRKLLVQDGEKVSKGTCLLEVEEVSAGGSPTPKNGSDPEKLYVIERTTTPESLEPIDFQILGHFLGCIEERSAGRIPNTISGTRLPSTTISTFSTTSNSSTSVSTLAPANSSATNLSQLGGSLNSTLSSPSTPIFSQTERIGSLTASSSPASSPTSPVAPSLSAPPSGIPSASGLNNSPSTRSGEFIYYLQTLDFNHRQILYTKRQRLLELYRKLKQKEPQFAALWKVIPPPIEHRLCLPFPHYKTKISSANTPPVYSVFGPQDFEGETHHFGNLITCQSVSTYPWLPGKDKREGSPICDQFRVSLHSHHAILCMADGCGWGPKSVAAASQATLGLVSYLEQTLIQPTVSVNKIAHYLTAGFAMAHNSIISQYSDAKDAGTSTLLGAVIVNIHSAFRAKLLTSSAPCYSPSSSEDQYYRFIEGARYVDPNSNGGKPNNFESVIPTIINEVPEKKKKKDKRDKSPSPSQSLQRDAREDFLRCSLYGQSRQMTQRFIAEYRKEENQFVCVCVCVGDCKLYHWNHKTKTVRDVTKGNRGLINDPKDPGGRLGPQQETGGPDLRNLKSHGFCCQSGDVIVIVSDGIHDDLDPELLGKTPNEIDPSLPAQWSDLTLLDAFNLRSDFACKLVQSFIMDEKGERKKPRDIAASLIEHAMKITSSSRDFMETKKKALPSDFKLYPGKMDHSTCICLNVHDDFLER